MSNYNDPNSPRYGQPVYGHSEKPQVFYRAGRPETYTSIYGYEKLRYPIYRTDENGDITGSPEGYVKEEVVPGVDGTERGRVYYERNGWRKQGQLRFYDSVEALCTAMDKPFWKPKAEEPAVQDDPTEAQPATQPDVGSSYTQY